MRNLVNAVVVGLILFVGGGLLLTAITRVRAAAGRLHCTNNLRALGMGLRGYHDFNNYFPAGTIPNKDLPPEKRLSWLVATMPYVEQLGLSLDRTKAWNADENLEPKGYGIEEEEFILGNMACFLCPANPHRAGPGRPGLTHYVGIAGLGPTAAEQTMAYPDLGLVPPDVGVFGYDRHVRLKDIKDGAAATMMVAEVGTDHGPWTAGGHATVRGLDPAGPPYVGPMGQFGGNHPGGIMVLFADGSARCLNESMDPQTFEALATIAGGDKAGE